MTHALTILGLLALAALAVTVALVRFVEWVTPTISFPPSPAAEDAEALEPSVTWCESCGQRPADKRVRPADGQMFAVCSSCAPLQSKVAR